MIINEEIQLVINELERRKCLLYHACHLKDFVSYLDLGCIPSRQLLETQNRPFTSFYTDTQDRTDGVFDKVFLNISDFGNTFSFGGRATPLIYGPILLAISPSCLATASEVAVCLRSAGTPGYNRHAESLNSSKEFTNIFKDSNGKKIRSATELEEFFPRLPIGGQPEISCTFLEEKVPFSFVKFVVVDPINILGYDLPKITQRLLQTNNLPKSGKFQDCCRMDLTRSFKLLSLI